MRQETSTCHDRPLVFSPQMLFDTYHRSMPRDILGLDGSNRRHFCTGAQVDLRRGVPLMPGTYNPHVVLTIREPRLLRSPPDPPWLQEPGPLLEQPHHQKTVDLPRGLVRSETRNLDE